MRIKSIQIKEIYIRWVGIFVLAIIAMLGDGDHMSGDPYWYQYLVAVCFTAVYWNGASFFIFRFRKLFPDIQLTGYRLLLTALTVGFWMVMGGIPVRLLFDLTTVEEVFTWQELVEMLPFNFTAAIVISLGYEAFYFFDRWKEQFRLNEQLKNQQMKTQYEVLQNQMSPHFLFNSLNTLASIIPDDAEAAVSFTEKLSEVYRYILTNKERELVTLKEELEFVDSYLFLLRMRFPSNLSYSVKIDKSHFDATIPPLTLQILVENAIKHNVVSKARPLHIDIYLENGKTVIVRNNLQRKDAQGKSTKTGLENIRKRYDLLGKKIDVIVGAESFMVAVPLIHLMEEKDLTFA